MWDYILQLNSGSPCFQLLFTCFKTSQNSQTRIQTQPWVCNISRFASPTFKVPFRWGRTVRHHVTWCIPHRPVAQTLKTWFLDPPSLKKKHSLYLLTHDKNQIFSSPLFEGGITLQCIRVFKAGAGNKTRIFNGAPERAGKKYSGADDLAQPFYSLKYIITYHAIFCFFKFAIKANVFWQQLVTRVPKEKRKVGRIALYQLLIVRLSTREREREGVLS